MVSKILEDYTKLSKETEELMKNIKTLQDFRNMIAHSPYRTKIKSGTLGEPALYITNRKVEKNYVEVNLEEFREKLALSETCLKQLFEIGDMIFDKIKSSK